MKVRYLFPEEEAKPLSLFLTATLNLMVMPNEGSIPIAFSVRRGKISFGVTVEGITSEQHESNLLKVPHQKHIVISKFNL